MNIFQRLFGKKKNRNDNKKTSLDTYNYSPNNLLWVGNDSDTNYSSPDNTHSTSFGGGSGGGAGASGSWGDDSHHSSSSHDSGGSSSYDSGSSSDGGSDGGGGSD